ncbi:uncharacterized protein LOC132803772 [Ziziphus jujuba]|uniref:Uncharacterized protein LOC132803772 n=1 Tax=Ziziphus jujuba TaxID=326968 RepID=A0ABM4A966_ZIZJJ|nr:uncharacterized protein LOC132803772 [Ziziphus jujuba]
MSIVSTPTSKETSAANPLTISTIPTLAIKNLVVISVATEVSIKLTETTYFSWKRQFDALLIRNNLYGFIDGALPCPSPVLFDSANSPNPDFIYWVRQDSLLLNAILASLSLEVHFVSDAETSREAWQKPALTFTKPSHLRLMRLCERLIRSQGSHPIMEYLQDVKAYANELSFIDNPVSNNDLTLCILLAIMILLCVSSMI